MKRECTKQLLIATLFIILGITLISRNFQFSGYLSKLEEKQEAQEMAYEEPQASAGFEDTCNQEVTYTIPPGVPLTDGLEAKFSEARGRIILVHPTGASSSYSQRQAMVHDPGPNRQFFDGDDIFNSRLLKAGIQPLPKLDVVNAAGPWMGEYLAYVRLSIIDNPLSRRQLVSVKPGPDRLIGTNDDVERVIPLIRKPSGNSWDEAWDFDIAVHPNLGITTVWRDLQLDQINILREDQDGERSYNLKSPGVIRAEASHNGFVYVYKTDYLQPPRPSYTVEIHDLGPEFIPSPQHPARQVREVLALGWDFLTDSTPDGKIFVYATGRWQGSYPFPDKIRVLQMPTGRLDSNVRELDVFTLPAEYTNLFIRDVAVTYLEQNPQGRTPPAIISFLVTPYIRYPALLGGIYSGIDGVFGAGGDDVLLPILPARIAVGSDNYATWMTAASDGIGLDSFWYNDYTLFNIRRC